jgi:hypothetical protein
MTLRVVLARRIHGSTGGLSPSAKAGARICANQRILILTESGGLTIFRFRAKSVGGCHETI